MGNLYADLELRHTSSDKAVINFQLVTNRSFRVGDNSYKEEVEIHNLVAWSKLAELLNKLLVKGQKVYIEGRLKTRTWESRDGVQKTITEIVVENFILLSGNKYNDELKSPYGHDFGREKELF